MYPSFRTSPFPHPRDPEWIERDKGHLDRNLRVEGAAWTPEEEHTFDKEPATAHLSSGMPRPKTDQSSGGIRRGYNTHDIVATNKKCLMRVRWIEYTVSSHS